MPTILLVHGAWHGSWCWAKVVFRLQQLGLNAITLDLPGRAGDTTPVADLTLERYARSVCGVAAVQQQPVIVVGHSMGGAVITQAAEYQPERFAKLVYLCAFLPRNGQSVRELAQTDPGLVLPNVRFDVPSGYVSFRDDASLREVFYGDCSEEDVRRAAALLVPEPIAPSATPVEVSADRSGRVPRAYIECRQDRAIPLSLQRSMVQAAPCQETFSLEASHSPFLSMPQHLADILAAISAPAIRE
jgi:pimeloyl-ACP methyl ester carboxylesterase